MPSDNNTEWRPGRMDAILAISALRGFIGSSQMGAIKQAMVGEEKQFFFDKMVELASLVSVMHKTYEQESKGDEAIVWLHYFCRSCDWWITEKDCETEQLQAFGFADLGDAQNAELGYISLVELLECGAELDMHFEPRTLAEVKAEKYPVTDEERSYGPKRG